VADTEAEALEAARSGVLRRDFEDYIWPLLARDDRLGLCKLDPQMANADVTVEYMIENVWIVGAPG